MRDHEIAQLVNSLTEVAREFHSAQQLRERISQLVVPSLATANERIRELEAKLDRYTRISESGLSLGDHLDCIVDLGIEREVSDKMEKALQIMVDEKCDYMIRNKLGDPEREHATKLARAALTEVAAIRAKQGGEKWTAEQVEWVNAEATRIVQNMTPLPEAD